MRRLVLERFLDSPHGVFGTMEMDGFTFFTCEDDWRDNAVGKSCIPPGTYRLRKIVSPKFGVTFEVTGVPGRSHILIHPLNTEEDTEGCIGVGLSLGVKVVRDEDNSDQPAKKLAVLQSRSAFERFMLRMGTDVEAVLDVKWYGE